MPEPHPIGRFIESILSDPEAELWYDPVMRPPVGTITYTVTTTLPDEATRARFIRWLLEDHIAKICAKGALSGTVLRLSDPALPLRTETRYLFPNPESLQTYLSRHAPALRAEGLAAFPPESGVRFDRVVGEVCGSVP